MCRQIFTFILLYYLFQSSASGQCPIVDFTVPDSACIGENISVINNSTNATSFSWDFCPDDFNFTPVSLESVSLSDGNSYHLFMITDSSSYYGFYTSYGSNKLFRLDFGDNINNTPVVYDLGNPNSLLNNPRGIKIGFDGKNWVGFVNNQGDNSVTRLIFGSSPGNSPSAINISVANLNNPVGMDLIKDSGQYYLIIVNYYINDLFIVNLGTTLTNDPSPADIHQTGTITGVNSPSDISMIKSCDQWYGLLTDYNNHLIRLNFSSGLMNDPVADVLSSSTQMSSPVLVEDNAEFFGFVSTNSGDLYKISYGSSIENPTPVIDKEPINNPSTGTWALSFIKQGTLWKGFSISLTKYKLIDYEYLHSSHASINSSNEITPGPFSFDSAGTYHISMSAYDSYGNRSSKLDSVIIKNLASPSITFSTSNTCLSVQNTFTGNSPEQSTIASWTWDFGDSSSLATGQTSNHTYTAVNSYPVSLIITAQNGCSNRAIGNVHIYNRPQPAFSILPSPACILSDISFQNQTISTAPDSLLSYQWNFNDEASYSVKDTIYQFTTAGIKNIILTAAIPGCSIDSLNTVDVQASPLSDFSFQNECDKIPVNFTNTTTGNYSQLSWEFGDGYTSSIPNPSHLYDSAGHYTLKLTTANDLGCQNIKYDTVTIFHYPIAGYENDLPCTGTAVGFYDTSKVSEANIIKYNWEISSPTLPGYSDTSSIKNPMFQIVEHGDYLVKLRAESNFGCADSISKTISFLPGPDADFGFNNACFGDSTYFINNSVAADTLMITSYFWEIDSTISNLSDPSYLFKSPGNYNVTLSVRAGNLCTGVTAKTVTINPSPVAGIVSENNCLNITSDLKDNSSAQGDSIVGYDWQIGNSMNFTGPEISLRFDSAGIYEILHSVTTAGGCEDDVANSIQIYPVPEASFIMIPPTGSPPLKVSFENKSSRADSYGWNFGVNDSINSHESDPVYTYNEEGVFRITLIAGNQYGCIDSASRSLSITPPVYDIVLKKVTAFENNGALRFIIDIANNGTVIVDNLNVAIMINNEYSISEPIDHTFYAGDTVSRLLNFQFLNTRSSKPDYICFKLEPRVEGQTEINTENNVACYTPENNFTLIEPYPNPVSRNLTVSFILTHQDKIEISLYSPSGGMLTGKSLENGDTGYHEFQFDMGTYSSGLYILSITGNNMKMMRKIFVVH